MSRERLTGRILNVWEEPLGTTLTADAVAGTTVLTVDDVSPFNAAGNEDGSGGMLQVGDQVVAYVDVDDDASTITLAAGLPTAVLLSAENDDVLVWNDLYGEVDTVQWVLVKPGGSRNQADPIQAIVGEAVQGLTNGDRGGPGEPCTLVRDGDEWELVSVGRPSPVKGGGIKFEADDVHVISSTDVTMGTASISLSHRPIDESLVAFWRATPQEPTEYTVNADAQTVTWPLSGFEQAGDRLWVHYAYTASLSQRNVGWQATGWRYLVVSETDTVDRSAVSFDDSSWTIGQGGFGNAVAADGTKFGNSLGWPVPTTVFDPPPNIGLWIRRAMPEPPANVPLTLRVRVDGDATIFWNGTQLATRSANGTVDVDPIDVPVSVRGGSDLLAIHIVDDVPDPSYDFLYLDARIEW